MQKFSLLSVLALTALVSAAQANDNPPIYEISPALVSGLNKLDPNLLARIGNTGEWKPTDPSLFNGADKSSELEIFKGKNSDGRACRLVVQKDSDQPGRLTFRIDRDISDVNKAIPTTFDTFALSSPTQPDKQWHHFTRESVHKRSIQSGSNDIVVRTQVKIEDAHSGSRVTNRYSDTLILRGADGALHSIEDKFYQDSRVGRRIELHHLNCTAE